MAIELSRSHCCLLRCSFYSWFFQNPIVASGIRSKPVSSLTLAIFPTTSTKNSFGISPTKSLSPEPTSTTLYAYISATTSRNFLPLLLIPYTIATPSPRTRHRSHPCSLVNKSMTALPNTASTTCSPNTYEHTESSKISSVISSQSSWPLYSHSV
ncbi:hypothetical protein BDU57DRAFT_18654 [Ampelomyces quisqualis]|uniref:Uncharacterized protein n=1 Tax=Ampelomyces quisqualis TaxID=50730 RepID=A0A6A5R0E4_AMPQU|nr:hypothetical protein BDU57DRAFT_18654 [Ampelomyces quisqualis]